MFFKMIQQRPFKSNEIVLQSLVRGRVQTIFVKNNFKMTLGVGVKRGGSGGEEGWG